MNAHKRSRISWLVSVGFHLLLIIALSALGIFNIVKKNPPIDVVFFDSVNAGGGGGGNSLVPNLPPAPASTLTTPSLNSDAIITERDSKAPTPDQTVSDVPGNAAAAYTGGSGTGVGSGTGSGTGPICRRRGRSSSSIAAGTTGLGWSASWAFAARRRATNSWLAPPWWKKPWWTQASFC